MANLSTQYVLFFDNTDQPGLQTCSGSFIGPIR